MSPHVAEAFITAHHCAQLAGQAARKAHCHESGQSARSGDRRTAGSDQQLGQTHVLRTRSLLVDEQRLKSWSSSSRIVTSSPNWPSIQWGFGKINKVEEKWKDQYVPDQYIIYNILYDI